MEDVSELKKEYNYWISRNNKAEKFFKVEPVEECMRHIKLFNEIAVKLSCLSTNIEKLTNKKMTNKEIMNGFE